MRNNRKKKSFWPDKKIFKYVCHFMWKGGMAPMSNTWTTLGRVTETQIFVQPSELSKDGVVCLRRFSEYLITSCISHKVNLRTRWIINQNDFWSGYFITEQNYTVCSIFTYLLVLNPFQASWPRKSFR